MCAHPSEPIIHSSVNGAPESGGSEPQRRATTAIAGTIGVALTAFAVVLTASESSSSEPWAAAVGRGAIVAVPMAVALYARAWRPYRRLGLMLFLVGVGGALAALAESNDSVLYSTGRVAGWIVEVGLVWVVLAFPSGVLTGRWGRGLVTAFAVLVLVGYMPTALLADGYPTPSPWTECDADCPANAFQVVDNEPAFVSHGLRTVREALTILIFLAVAGVLAGRVRSSTRLTRLMVVPVLAVAVARLLVFIVGFGVRRADPDSPLLGAIGWTIALLVPAMAVAFLIGLLRWQLFSARALERLAVRLLEHPDAQQLRNALAAALGDPWLDLAVQGAASDGEWVDAGGRHVDLTAVARHRSVTTIREGDVSVAMVHDRALDEHPDFVRAAGNYAAMALDNHQLVAQVTSSLREVQDSRARIAASADAERRRIERDLHDGAQQRLVALRIKLGLAEEALLDDPGRSRELLHEIGDETVEALEDVRSLAHGVYPALLMQRGLRDALRDAALRSPVRVQVEAHGIGRYPPEVESAVYFCCMEAMQNAIKHGVGASLIAIALSDDGRLRFEVADDGGGFDTVGTPPGAGLANMRDRLAAVGGALSYRSQLSKGTQVVGVVPAA
jgi:signal transduction histidine kinase